VIRGTTTIIAHLGDPIAPVKSPMIYNPYFESAGIDAAVVPMGVRSADYPEVLKAIFRFTNIRGALVTMPHKVTTVALLDDCSIAVKIAQSCNAVLRRPDGKLFGDLFDGAGFVRGLARNGFKLEGAAADVSGLALADRNTVALSALADRLRAHYPKLEVTTGSSDPAGLDLVVNATPLGMNPGDPLPFDVTRLSPRTFVGEVVMKQEVTPLLRAARERGCRTQVGTEMLFEQIPLYLEFFGFGAVTSDELRAVAALT
jgi:shikimate dehydrogenase